MVEAAVVQDLPMSVLLGIDNPKRPELLREKKSNSQEQAFAVITRAETKRQNDEEARKSIQTRECGVQPNSLDEIAPG